MSGNSAPGTILLEDSQGEQEEIEIELGYINPLETNSGVKTRLANLHHATDPTSEALDEHTANALREFQLRHDLEVTGVINAATKDKLQSLHNADCG
jgi:peptidoglycan hydrolase-like protein with peptidoglycan-binding domain